MQMVGDELHRAMADPQLSSRLEPLGGVGLVTRIGFIRHRQIRAEHGNTCLAVVHRPCPRWAAAAPLGDGLVGGDERLLILLPLDCADRRDRKLVAYWAPSWEGHRVPDWCRLSLDSRV